MPSPSDRNPLCDIRLPVPFDEIRAEHVEPAIDEHLREATARQRELANGSSPPTFRNTLLVLDTFTERLDYAMAVVRHLESVATTEALRSAYNSVQPKVNAFYASIPLDEKLWGRLKEFARTPEAGALSGVHRRFFTKTLDNFRRHGAELDAQRKARLAEIEVELGKCTTRFAENVLDATNSFELVLQDESMLAGLPPSAVAAARQSAEAKGISGWRFTLQAPSYTALMTYLDNRAIREQVWRAYNTRASEGAFNNRPLLTRILELRREKATLLGYPSFAAYVLEDRMARTVERVQQFLEQLKARTEKHFVRENEELQNFRRSLEGADADELQPWDIAYYVEKQRAALYEFDEEDLRPYFPLERVVEGMFEIARRLYGIFITELDGVPCWDPQVKYYKITDQDGSLLGYFYADWYPRENKRSGAWMDFLITGGPLVEGFKPHLGLVCGNLTPPVGAKPALLTHREVETIFHEFGHLLHHCLSRVEIRSLAGTNVAWDFVELPSQIMENWCWEKEALDLFARHYETGETIPEDLYQKMRRARTYRSANSQMRQLGFAFVDMALHTDYSPVEDPDPIAYSLRILQEFSPAKLPEDYAMLASFTHLFSDPDGYAAGYYSYKWAEVLDADAFSRFQAEGTFNKEVGRQFREAILSRGEAEEPAVLFRSFMGRDPDPEALLRRLGLSVSA
jgi:oligopeptidase A